MNIKLAKTIFDAILKEHNNENVEFEFDGCGNEEYFHITNRYRELQIIYNTMTKKIEINFTSDYLARFPQFKSDKISDISYYMKKLYEE